LERISKSLQIIDPVFLNTPQFRSDILSRELGADVVLKIETMNPIRSFKGRGPSPWSYAAPTSSLTPFSFRSETAPSSQESDAG
jgi:threonine dehydratase